MMVYGLQSGVGYCGSSAKVLAMGNSRQWHTHPGLTLGQLLKLLSKTGVLSFFIVCACHPARRAAFALGGFLASSY